MATTTTNFGWDIPQSTDLVKDGATAIAALGQDIDTALVDLKGGTTGQVLAKASGTDLDFSWVAQDDSNAIQNAIVDAKGDLISATAADTPARLAVGANGTVLTADSAEATGLKWATPQSGGMTTIASGNIANSATGFSITSIPGTYNNLQLVIRNAYNASADFTSKIRLNNDSSSIYSWLHNWGASTTVFSGTDQSSTNFKIDNFDSSRAANTSVYVINFWDYAGDSFKCGSFTSYHQERTTGTYAILNGAFGYRSTSAINRIDLISGSATTFAGAGTYTLYGVK